MAGAIAGACHGMDAWPLEAVQTVRETNQLDLEITRGESAGTTHRFMINRLVSLGNVIIDIVAEVPALPERGGDVLASGVALEVGGGFNLMAAAARQGLDVAYAGALGHGLFSDLARRALRAEGIALLLPDDPGEQRDTGFDVVLVDAGGERTFVTAVGAEAGVTSQRLDHVEIRPTDAVLISGYGLLHDANRRAILDRLRSAPTRDHGVLRPRAARSHAS